MSVFKVQLNNSAQGLLDRNPATLGQASPSIQRSVYVTGPNKINRRLVDGETFTDCNYWKKFAYPQVSLEHAIVSVLTDDGSVYSDVASENVYPKVYDLSVAAGSAFEDNQADVIGDTGGFATFTQITNTHGSQDVRIRLNGQATAIFDLAFGESQIFNAGELSVSLIEVSNDTSGAAGPVLIQILMSVKSVCNS